MGLELKWVLCRKYGRVEDVNGIPIGGSFSKLDFG